MRTTVTRRYHFEAAHFLPKVPAEHKCSRMHGHNYVLDVTMTRPELDRVGFIIDFWDLDTIVHPLIQHVDHSVLNEKVGLENPTAEFIAAWFLERIGRVVREEYANDGLVAVSVTCFETPDCHATVMW